MKNYKERTEYIINEINRRTENKRKKRAAMERFTYLAACLCFTVILGCHVFGQLESIKKTPLMKINSAALSELPDPRSVNDISAYVSQIIAITSPDKTGIYSEKGISQAYIAETQTETAPESKKITEEQAHTSLSAIPYTAKTKANEKSTVISKKLSAVTNVNTCAANSPSTVKTCISRIPAATAVTNGNEGYGGDENGCAYDWNDMSVYQKFDTIVFNGITYLTYGNVIYPESLAEKIGDTTAVGIDMLLNETHYTNAEIFRIENMPDSQSIAVRFEDHEEYYVYTGIDN